MATPKHKLKSETIATLVLLFVVLPVCMGIVYLNEVMSPSSYGEMRAYE